jgi:hypothetical protein
VWSHSHSTEGDAFPISTWIGLWHRGQESAGVFVLRVVDDSVSFADLDDLSIEHDGDPVADMVDHRHVMADEEVAQSEFILEIVQEIQDLRLDGYVQGRSRLVAHDHPRLKGESAGDSYSLALATAEFVRISIGRLLPQTASLQKLLDPGSKFLAFSKPVDEQRFPDQSANPHSGIERTSRILEDDLHLPSQGPHFSRVLLEDRSTIKRHFTTGGW